MKLGKEQKWIPTQQMQDLDFPQCLAFKQRNQGFTSLNWGLASVFYTDPITTVNQGLAEL